MKRTTLRCAAGLLMTAVLLPTALTTEPFPAATEVQVCYPTSVTHNEDGIEIRKVYDLSPEQDPAGIPRSDFEQDGSHYTLTDLLQQGLPGHESRSHTETVSLESRGKDTESVLVLLPQEKEFVTEDGLSDALSLQPDTVQMGAAGYDSSAREVSATRSYPSLASQDTASTSKSIEEDGHNLTLQNTSWRTDNTASVVGYNLGGCHTAVATYTGTTTSSYITGYTVATDYAGTTSRIALNRVRYVAIFGGEPLKPTVSMEESGDGLTQFNWAAILLLLGVVFVMGGVIGACLFVKRHQGDKEDSE